MDRAGGRAPNTSADEKKKMDVDQPTAPPEKRLATRGEIVAKLNLVPVFSVSDLDTQSICATLVGNQPCGTWFADVRDAEALLAKLRQHNPAMNLGIEATPLGHALALSEKWVPAAAKLTTRIQASTRELASLPGFPELPDELKKAFNPLTSRFPVWVCEDLHTAMDMPFFLHADDLKDAWFKATGKSLDDAKELDVTDLRVLVAKMCCQVGNWGVMNLLPPQRTVEYMQARKAKMVEDGELPPPLADDQDADEADAGTAAGAEMPVGASSAPAAAPVAPDASGAAARNQTRLTATASAKASSAQAAPPSPAHTSGGGLGRMTLAAVLVALLAFAVTMVVGGGSLGDGLYRTTHWNQKAGMENGAPLADDAAVQGVGEPQADAPLDEELQAVAEEETS